MRPNMRMPGALVLVCLAGCAELEGPGTPLGSLATPYEADAPRYTSKGVPVVCDTAGPPGHAVTRCY